VLLSLFMSSYEIPIRRTAAFAGMTVWG